MRTHGQLDQDGINRLQEENLAKERIEERFRDLVDLVLTEGERPEGWQEPSGLRALHPGLSPRRTTIQEHKRIEVGAVALTAQVIKSVDTQDDSSIVLQIELTGDKPGNMFEITYLLVSKSGDLEFSSCGFYLPMGESKWSFPRPYTRGQEDITDTYFDEQGQYTAKRIRKFFTDLMSIEIRAEINSRFEYVEKLLNELEAAGPEIEKIKSDFSDLYYNISRLGVQPASFRPPTNLSLTEAQAVLFKPLPIALNTLTTSEGDFLSARAVYWPTPVEGGHITQTITWIKANGAGYFELAYAVREGGKLVCLGAEIQGTGKSGSTSTDSDAKMVPLSIADSKDREQIAKNIGQLLTVLAEQPGYNS